MNLIVLSVVTGVVLAVEAVLLVVLFVHLAERVSAHLTARRLLRVAIASAAVKVFLWRPSDWQEIEQLLTRRRRV